jgi:hypothetical protein
MQVSTMTAQLTPETFLPHVDKAFRVKGGRHVLTLTQVDIPRLETEEAGRVPRQPFSLIFRGPAGDVLREGAHSFEIDNGPTVELYVIPVQTFARDRQDYQAVFN